MSAKRPKIPKAVQEAVLKEYRHKCAVCGEDRPQLHHIDEDRTNHDRLNLLPLCPNCHLSDQHNPTSRHDPHKLTIFRVYKDPAVLSPQFHAIFKRIHFLFHLPDDASRTELVYSIFDLQAFIRQMEMGHYYAHKLVDLIGVHSVKDGVSDAHPIQLSDAMSQGARLHGRRFEAYLTPENQRAWVESQRKTLAACKDEVLDLLVESLRFQKWGADA